MNRRFLLTAAALLLAGCTTLTGPVGTRRFSGRFSLRTASAENVQTAAGKYRLTATGDVYELVILSPLNGVLGKVTVTPSEARVERGGHPDLTANGRGAKFLRATRCHRGTSNALKRYSRWSDWNPRQTVPYAVLKIWWRSKRCVVGTRDTKLRT